MNFPHGDVPDQHVRVALNLHKIEALYGSATLSQEDKAAAYVLAAGGWFTIGMDEEGHRMLQKAEDTFPGYFGSAMAKQYHSDQNFAIVVHGIIRSLMWNLVQSLKEKK